MMQVEAIYENGQVRFVTPIRLKKHSIRLLINIPDNEIEQGQEGGKLTTASIPESLSSSFSAELKAITAPVRKMLESADNRALSKEDMRDLQADAWEEKHSG
jgi:hypothetical protein